MAKSRKSAGFDPRVFFKDLQNLLDTLPSESQKQEINNAFTELIGFLTDLQNIFWAMPSIEDSANLKQSLLKLEESYASAEKIPIIAESVGATRRPSKPNASASQIKNVGIDAKQILANLAKLPADAIRSQLDVMNYSKQSLQLIASEMGLKTNSNATRKSLTDKIATDIVNQRMRDGLAGRASRESSVS